KREKEAASTSKSKEKEGHTTIISVMKQYYKDGKVKDGDLVEPSQIEDELTPKL
ncbi:15254_t:CDS:2, partial [Cetraspora pellucida]